MFCQNCGAELDPSLPFCSKCGNQIQKSPEAHPPETAYPVVKKRIPIWFKLLASVVVLLAIFAGFIVAFTDDLVVIAQGQLTALHTNQLTEAYYKYTSKDFQEATSLEAFRNFIKEYPIFSSYTSATFEPEKIENDIGVLKGTLTEQNGTKIPVEFRLTKDDNEWKVASISMQESDQTSGLKPASQEEAGGLLAPVKEQLKDLHSNNVQKAYDSTSPEFRKITPLPAFQDFIRSFSIVTHYSSVDFKEPLIGKNIGKVVVEFHQDKETQFLEYTLGREEGSWKIFGMQILSPPENASNPQTQNSPGNFKVENLVHVVQGQLNALKSKNFNEAYSQYSSSSFQSAHSLQKFEEMVNQNPILTNNQSSKFNRLTIQNGIATLSGTITSPDNLIYPAEYTLVQDGDSWKIDKFQINPPAEHEQENQPNPTSPTRPPVEEKKTAPSSQTSKTPFPMESKTTSNLEFTKAVIGTEVDANGLVVNPTNIIISKNNDIIINLYVHNGTAGTKVSMTFKHLDSNAKIPPISTTLQQAGDTTVSFVFSPPEQGWPNGLYEIDARASTGEEQVFNFKVE